MAVDLESNNPNEQVSESVKQITVETGGKRVNNSESSDTIKLGLGLGIAGLFLRRSTPEIESFEEDKYSNLSFEAGIHPNNEQAQVLFQDLLENGNPDIHLWNPQVAQRLKNRDCRVICIDGIGFSSVSNGDGVTYLPNVNWHTWAALPDRPQNINNEGRVHVIGGDNMFIEDSFEQGFAQDANKKQAFIRGLGKGERMGDGEGAFKNAVEGKIFSGVLAASLAITIYQLHKHQDDAMSRRDFFKFIGKKVVPPSILAGLKDNHAVNAIINGAANATTSEQADIYLNLARLSGPDLIYDDWVRARTASMVLKTKDGLDILQNDPESGVTKDDSSAIVAGNAHAPEAKGFLESEERAGKEVLMYAQKMVDAAYKVLQETSDVIIARQDVIAHVKYHLSQTFIYEVNDPGTDMPDPKFVDSLQNHIKTTHDFKSTRILAALKDLK